MLLNRMCVCVGVFSSHSFWTLSSLDVPAGVTQEEGHTGFVIHLLSAVRALIFLARRIQPFLSLVDCEVEFCVPTNLIVLHPLGIFILFFCFLVRKIPLAGIELTSQRVRGLLDTSELPGRPAGKLVIAHTRKQHRTLRCNTLCLVDESKESLDGRETDRDLGSTC